MSKISDLLKKLTFKEEIYSEEEHSELSASRPSLEEVMSEPPKPQEEKPAEEQPAVTKEEEKTDVVESILGREQQAEEVKIDSLILEETDENNRIITKKRKHREYFKGSLHEVTVSRLTLLVWGLLIVIVSVLLSFIVADKIFFRSGYSQTSYKVNFNEELSDSSEIAKLQSVITTLENNFYPGVEKNVLIEGAIEGMVNALGDQFTVYYRPGTMNQYTELINGTYEGLGIKFLSDSKGLIVDTINSKSPASKADIKEGDIVTKIGGVDTVGITNDKLVEAMSKSDDVELEILADEEGKENRKITITIDQVAVQSVFEKSLGSGLYRISITQFDEDTGEEFQKKLSDLIGKGGCKGIVLDLRDNGGGYETEASKVADMILPKGTIATAQDNEGNVFKTIKSEASEIEIPIVVLVNENTASAAELVAGAVKDFGKGKLVGVKTYGKAIGQARVTFDTDNSGLVLTVACFYTPSGNCIQGKGITPDETVELPEEFRGKPISAIPGESDTQLLKALQILHEEVKK